MLLEMRAEMIIVGASMMNKTRNMTAAYSSGLMTPRA